MRKIIILVAILILFAAMYFFLGFYNVSATKPHSKVIEMVFHSISESSIKRNAKGVKNPYDVNDKEIYVKGFREYEEMCVQCHGAPGIEPSATGKGLNPKPPIFPEEELYEYTLEDIFWVTKNGVKMTGMPAYGPTHDDEVIWSIAIFLDKSRNLTEEEYKKLKDKFSETDHEHNHGD
ncbi:MAG: c-type cytochrome [Thermodesulfobacteriota bacterium]